MGVKLRYFAWVREKIGVESETIDLPSDIVTVRDLLAWQQERSEQYASAFEHGEVIRVALDQEHVEHDTPIAGISEIAFFPPMTGG